MHNLLDTPDLEPPMGDLSSTRTLSDCRSIWTTPRSGERDAPEHRIIHSRVFKPHGSFRLKRVGIRNAKGYHKCGSSENIDWIVDLRILSLDKPEGTWQELIYERGLEEQKGEGIKWFDFSEIQSFGLILEIRRCGIDQWWTPWNLAQNAFIVEGTLEDPVAPRKENLLECDVQSLDNLPPTLEANIKNGELRYKSPNLEVGFCLARPGFSYLSIDQDGKGNTGANLLEIETGSFHQGPMLSLVGQSPTADQAVRFRFEGKIHVTGNQIHYSLTETDSGQCLDLLWTVFPDRLELSAKRKGRYRARAWVSSAWTIAMRPTTSAAHAIGPLTQHGETGLLSTPICLHAPNFGSFALESEGETRFRMNVSRGEDKCLWELKLGEEPMPEGDWNLAEGSHSGCWTFRIVSPTFKLNEQTPAAIKRALEHSGHTALTFRPDTGTLSNNGASMHCPISMDTWSAQLVRMGDVLPGFAAKELLRYSLERWLDGGPGYASGNLRKNGKIHTAEDEYLMTGAAALMGLAEYLDNDPPKGWLERFGPQIHRKFVEMRARDIDHDGLIESPYRTGVSGSGQWSTCWFDVISYGWKDAFSNAILYEALTIFSRNLDSSPLSYWSDVMTTWAKTLKESYFSTFFNPITERFVGWVCKEGKRHDYAFLPTNGAAVAAGLVNLNTGQEILSGLLDEMKAVKMPSARLGLPGNLLPIPDKDLSDIIQGYPFGYYQNGGRTHAQSRHFLRGLYRVGLDEAADQLLVDLCSGIVEEGVFGGCKSGVDWRYWDGRPSGYEGLLTDQFGFLAVALERFGE